MQRRDVLKVGLGGAVAGLLAGTGGFSLAEIEPKDLRAQYPWLEHETYLNGAGMMPLSIAAKEALQKYINIQHFGYHRPEETYRREVFSNTGKLFAKMIGAAPNEVTEITCTKEGEQIVRDSLPALRKGGNIVTNDLIFSGSMHNLVGLQKAGLDVRIVKSKNYKVTAADMEAAMDAKTALVSVALVSNINGHMEEIKALSDAAHKHGALLYADIVQAAGIVPVDVKAMGIDVAACSCYKWMHGIHGTAFLFVDQRHQGKALPNQLFPGHSRHNYAPWVEDVDPEHGEFTWRAPTSAHRYQPGHFNYLGFCAAYEGLKFIERYGVANLLAHSVALNQYLYERIDRQKFPCITPDRKVSPMISFANPTKVDLRGRLKKAGIRASVGQNRMRISPARFNNQSDMDKLLNALI